MACGFCSKSLKKHQSKNILEKYPSGYQKGRIKCWIQNSSKNIKKNYQEKVTHKKLKQCPSKSQKGHFYLTVLFITFVYAFWGDFVIRFEISIELCVFNRNGFFSRIFLGALFYSTFRKLWMQIRKRWSKIWRENFVINRP